MVRAYERQDHLPDDVLQENLAKVVHSPSPPRTIHSNSSPSTKGGERPLLRLRGEGRGEIGDHAVGKEPGAERVDVAAGILVDGVGDVLIDVC